MSTELIPILALVVMFIAATVWPVNMGALGFVAAFFVGTLAVGMSTDDIIGGFPSELFLTLVGVTYLFAIAQNNGTVDLMVRGAVRLVRGRVALIPWVMFGITGVLTAVGALGPAAVAIIAPIALGFAARYKINPLLMGMMVIHGAQAGGFSPISIYGVTVNTITADAGLVDSPLALFLGSLLFNAAIGVLLFVFLGGRALIGQHVDDHLPEVADTNGSSSPVSGPSGPSGSSGDAGVGAGRWGRDRDQVPSADPSSRRNETRHQRKGFLSRGWGTLPVPRLYVVVKRAVVPDSVQSSSVRNGRGLLRVSFEVVLYAEWSLAPTYFIGWIG